MGDQGRWFKLWVGADEDPHLASLPLDDFARWSILGLYLKVHGRDGKVALPYPYEALQRRFRVSSPEAVIGILRRFPNCLVELSGEGPGKTVTDSTIATVTWRNWRKYQGDFSGERVRAHRQRRNAVKTESVTRQEEKRREEKRREEKKERTSVGAADSPQGKENGFAAWPPEWDPLKARIDALPFLAKHKHWLEELSWWRTMDEWLASAPKALDELLVDAVAHIASEGYVPRTKAALRRKLKNCLNVAGRIAEREAQKPRG